jgi:hypothetical protein
MGHFDRLELVGRVTYYVGWITLLAGGMVHFNVATKMFLALGLTKRNLFEVSMVCFVICIASALRASNCVGDQMSGSVKKV